MTHRYESSASLLAAGLLRSTPAWDRFAAEEARRVGAPS
jgi:hypothetical protein